METNRSPLHSIRHLDYVVLLCRDVPRMRAFYENVMGFPFHKSLGDNFWVELRAGSVLLTLRPRGGIQPGGKDSDGRWTEGAASVQLAFRVAPSEVDACHRKLVEQGIEILEPPKDQPWQHRTLFFRDPEHNVLEIYADL
ncbi:VOC family protein [Hyalangium versicolor]|uniref:VOC family protein n=1 Tax=Hyalangium versicolor TaxID=2861190 RepID=UPI001CCDBF3C|nr:VOC family protein [Hyalangium versicolor]